MKIIRSFTQTRVVTVETEMVEVQCSRCPRTEILRRRTIAHAKIYLCRHCRFRGRRAANYQHGGSTTRLYSIWREMKQRCTNPKRDSYRWYGALGISVCEEWSSSFVAFRDWALSHGYKDNLQLDRKENSKNYEPGNCQWSTPLQQAGNRKPRQTFARR